MDELLIRDSDAIADNFQPQGLNWLRVKHNHPETRRSLHVVVGYVSNKLPVVCIMGGWDPQKGRCNDVWQSLDMGLNLECVCYAAQWSPRLHFCCLASTDGSRIYVLGGDDGDYRSDIWLSTDQCRSFSLVNRSCPWTARGEFNAVTSPDGETLLVCGGRTVGEPITLLNDVWKSLDGGLSWIQLLISAPWSPRAGASLVRFAESQLILMCGSQGYQDCCDDIWTSADFGKTWKFIPVTKWQARTAAPLVYDEISREILLLGGTAPNGRGLDDVWASRDCVTWRRRPPLPTAGRTNGRALSLCGALWLSGGEDFWGQAVSDLWRSDGELSRTRADIERLLRLAKKFPTSLDPGIWITNVFPFLFHCEYKRLRPRATTW